MRRPKLPSKYSRDARLTKSLLGDRQPTPDNYLMSMFHTSLVSEILIQVKAERVRQVEQEGFTPAHDDEHVRGEIALAAACFALVSTAHPDGPLIHETIWPWEKKWWKPKDRRDNLIRAAALIVAEIERIDRKRRDATPMDPSGDGSYRSPDGA